MYSKLCGTSAWFNEPKTSSKQIVYEWEFFRFIETCFVSQRAEATVRLWSMWLDIEDWWFIDLPANFLFHRKLILS